MAREFTTPIQQLRGHTYRPSTYLFGYVVAREGWLSWVTPSEHTFAREGHKLAVRPSLAQFLG